MNVFDGGKEAVECNSGIMKFDTQTICCNVCRRLEHLEMFVIQFGQFKIQFPFNIQNC